MEQLARMRTISQAAKFFKENDPDTTVNEYVIRRLVKQRAIPIVEAGNRKVLLNLDKLIEYFNTGSGENAIAGKAQNEGYGKIRPVNL